MMWSELLSASFSFRCHTIVDVLDVLVYLLSVLLLMRVLVATIVLLLALALLSASLVPVGRVTRRKLLRFCALFCLLLLSVLSPAVLLRLLLQSLQTLR